MKKQELTKTLSGCTGLQTGQEPENMEVRMTWVLSLSIVTQIEAVFIGTQMKVVFIGTQMKVVFIGTRMKVVFIGTRMKEVFIGTRMKVVFIGTRMKVVFFGTQIKAVFIGTRIKAVFIGTLIKAVFIGTLIKAVFIGTQIKIKINVKYIWTDLSSNNGTQIEVVFIGTEIKAVFIGTEIKIKIKIVPEPTMTNRARHVRRSKTILSLLPKPLPRDTPDNPAVSLFNEEMEKDPGVSSNVQINQAEGAKFKPIKPLRKKLKIEKAMKLVTKTPKLLTAQQVLKI
ncbi:hypothetical protein DPMN_004238, partial [Dreissena polymorpha]